MLDESLLIGEEFVEDAEHDIIDEFPQDFIGCCNKLVAECLEDFFENERFYCGGSINPEVFCSDECIDTVLNTDIKTGVPYAYSIMEREGEWDSSGEIGDDVALVLRVFEKCAFLSIPKCFRAGILLLYLQLCYGCDIRRN